MNGATSPSTAQDAFHPATRAWFRSAFAASTPVQEQAWASIAAGRHTLVIAPTGSGKTLAAFLHAIDQVFSERDREAREAPGAAPARRTRVLYLSPIKALGADVERNLQLPLAGISAERARRGEPVVALTVGVRSGDSSASERARLLRRPPDILITTPESLYLMLTSQARATLADVHTIIVDEIHAVAGGKRGSHLALSLERLERVLPRPAQRIGLSATVRPVEQVAAFLGGDRPVQVVAPPSSRQRDVRVIVPVPDMADLAAQSTPGDGGAGQPASIWPHLEAAILEQVLQHRSTIVFANARGVAEKLTARLNELHARTVGPAAVGEDSGVAQASFTGSTVNRVTPGPLPVARSHHGSVSKEQRAQIEQALKCGELRCVVATSSLELGIDMGEVDLVIQVAAPPSVASALQRVGRAGHQVGGVSRGRIYPRTRRDLLDAAVVVDSMQSGRIEAISAPRNPLDVLAQQTVAAVAMEPLDVEQWYACVRRAAPYRELPRSAFEAVLDMLAGRYPSEDFAGFRPRLVWNRQTGQLSARPGARQLAVTSGGTIADRGMYSVVLPQGEETAGARRVGELDEEMVHESRVNDVITLGATSWRIEQITHDQVVVMPAPGRSARLPFWRGEGAGRPAELGRAIGAFLAELERAEEPGAPEPLPEALQARLQHSGLDENAISNLLALVREQRTATGVLPTDTRLLVERCRDELGDWRLILHSPYGRRVHEPWALAVAARLQERWGIDPAVVASDDGIVARIPDRSGRVPGAELFVFEPDSLRRMITAAVGGSALFAARFRECASRALLLPRRQPGRRSPLWQQRLRASQLLQVARAWPEFPILIETARECLQDVYDLDALDALMQRVQQGRVSLLEATTAVPSPFAAGLLFGYVAQFLYEADAPLAERRASMLSLDSGLLGELLGSADVAALLDPAVVSKAQQQLQRLEETRKADGMEGAADLLRELGPLDESQVAARLLRPQDASAHLQELFRQQRVVPVAIAGRTHWVAVEDAARVRDALGCTLPEGLPATFLHAHADPLGDLFMRHARTHVAFSTEQLAARFGLGVAVAQQGLQQLLAQGRLLQGAFEAAATAGSASHAPQAWWIAEAVWRRLRVRSLQAAREATRPVPGQVYVQLLLQRHGVLGEGPAGGQGAAALAGIDGVLRVIEQLSGVALPVSIWESQVLAARVRDYTPALLDELLATGAIFWRGHGRLGDDDGLVSLHLHEGWTQEAHSAASDATTASEPGTALQGAIAQVLGDGGAYFARQLAVLAQTRRQQAGVDSSGEGFQAALWELAWQGRISSDIWTPLRALGEVRRAPRARATSPSQRRRSAGFSLTRAPGSDNTDMMAASPTLAGRWSLLPQASASSTASDTERALLLAEALLDRHGVVTRGAVMAESIEGGFPAMQTVYRSMEDAGQVLRGRFVSGLGGAQYAQRATIDHLRELAAAHERDATPASAVPVAVALSALDPANPYGSVLPWPALAGAPRPVRRAGALLVIGAGWPLLYLAQGGRMLISYIDAQAEPPAGLYAAAAQALAVALRRGRRQTFTVEKINDAAVQRGPLVEALRAAGFSNEPRGLGWNG